MNACVRKGGEKNLARNHYCYTIFADKQIVQLYNHAAGTVSLNVRDIRQTFVILVKLTRPSLLYVLVHISSESLLYVLVHISSE